METEHTERSRNAADESAAERTFSERARYVTEQVALWIANDGDHHDKATAELVMHGVETMGAHLANVIRLAKPYSAPWQVAQELEPNDYARINWADVAAELTHE